MSPRYVAGSLLFTVTAETPVSEQQYNITVGVGTDISEARFTWMSKNEYKPQVQLAKASAVKNSIFPAKSTYEGTSSEMYATEGILDNKDSIEKKTAEYSNMVTVAKLAQSTVYAYRVGDGKNWSAVHTFKTAAADKISFAAFGDPQIGASKDLVHDRAGWSATLADVVAEHPDITMLFSAGDQVNDYDSLAKQQDEYVAFFNPDPSKDYLQSFQLAVDEGNHDLQMGKYYSFHYNEPNVSELGQTANAGKANNDGDYYFCYGPALFIMLEGNNFLDTAAHDEFMEKATKACRSAKWIIVSFHQAPYSEANHANGTDPDDNIVFMCQNWTKLMDKYHVDVVINGHDHYYIRTFQMLNGMPVDTTVASSANKPKKTLYVTLDSGSGSKYYKYNTASDHSYSAAGWQNNQPTYSYVTVTAKQFAITTYNVETGETVDSYTINK